MVKYRGKKLRLQFTSVSAYIRARMILKDQCVSVFLRAVDEKFQNSVGCMTATLSKLCPLLLEPLNPEPACLLKDEVGQGSREFLFARNRAELLYYRYE